MASRQYRTIVLAVLSDWANRAYGGSITAPWLYKTTKHGAAFYNTWKFQDRESGGGPFYARFQVYFCWGDPLCQFKLHFVGRNSAYYNKKFGLREIVTEHISSVLESTCKGKERITLFVGEAA